jgi:hypothetical protein
MKYYTLEVCEPGTEFEEYDSDAIDLKLCLWEDSIEGKDEEDLRYINLRVLKKDTLLSLKNKIMEKLNIDPMKEILVFKKAVFSSHSFNIIHIYQNKNDYDKDLFICCITDETRLFIEPVEKDIYDLMNEENINNNFISDNSKFFKYFKGKQNTDINIKFNCILPKGTKVIVTNLKWENDLIFKKDTTLKEVKQKISDYLGLDANAFIMRKQTYTGTEMRDLSSTLGEYTTGPMNIFIEYGTPLLEGNNII